jgi:hypothetical protein
LNLLDNSNNQENQDRIETNFKAIQALLRAKSNVVEIAETKIALQYLIKITTTTTTKQMKEIIIKNNNLLDKITFNSNPCNIKTIFQLFKAYELEHSQKLIRRFI